MWKWKWKLKAEVPERLISMEAEAAKVAEAEASKCWKQKRKYYMRERRLKAEAPEVTIFFMEAEAANVEWMKAETEAVKKNMESKGEAGAAILEGEAG